MSGRPSAGAVFEKYQKLLGFGGRAAEMDRAEYDMGQRVKLAGIVASEGHNVVADLGSLSGGMTHALRECGLDAISVERYDTRAFPLPSPSEKQQPSYFEHLKKVNDKIVRCDAFRLPLRGLDALVSYMFLGDAMWYKLHAGRKVKDVFGKLSESAGTIYSVELQSEYSEWFDGTATKKMLLLSERLEMSANRKMLEPEEIEEKLKRALGSGWDVEYLGVFGTYAEKSQEHVMSDLTGDLKGDIKADAAEHTMTRVHSRKKCLRIPERAVDRIGFKFTKKKGGLLDRILPRKKL